jgi:hypothetical protein
MKGEIAELVKESLKKETDEQEEDEMGIEMDSMDDMGDEDEMEIDMDMDDEDDMDVEDMEMDMEMDFDMDSEDEQPIDLTNASDEEILKVFKSMGDEDGIIVKKDNNQITLRQCGKGSSPTRKQQLPCVNLHRYLVRRRRSRRG